MFCVSLFFNFIGDTLTLNDIPYGVMSVDHEFIVDRSITSKTVKGIDRSNDNFHIKKIKEKGFINC